jgi:ABC-type lipoprotein release transport system permease subunit
VIYVLVAVLVMLMTLAGSLRPAMRAASIDPAMTIRTE